MPAKGRVATVQAVAQKTVVAVVPVHRTPGGARVAAVAVPEEPATVVATRAEGAGGGRRSAPAVPPAPAKVAAACRTATAAAAGEGVA